MASTRLGLEIFSPSARLSTLSESALPEASRTGSAHTPLASGSRRCSVKSNGAAVVLVIRYWLQKERLRKLEFIHLKEVKIQGFFQALSPINFTKFT